VNVPAPLPLLVLWRGDGCHLCDETEELLDLLLAERARAGLPVPPVEHKRIVEYPEVEREIFEQIPVLEMNGVRLPLALRPGPIRSWLATMLDNASGRARP
jgi:hypothetical protein